MSGFWDFHPQFFCIVDFPTGPRIDFTTTTCSHLLMILQEPKVLLLSSFLLLLFRNHSQRSPKRCSALSFIATSAEFQQRIHYSQKRQSTQFRKGKEKKIKTFQSFKLFIHCPSLFLYNHSYESLRCWKRVGVTR